MVQIMEKIIITATTANSWIYPNIKNWAENSDGLIKDAVECAEAGASIIHIHLPRSNAAKEIVAQIRDKTDVIIQAGMSSYPIDQRDTDFEAYPDMLSIILNHHDEHFTQVHVNQIHSLEELELYCKKCMEYSIKPEWEVWHTGSYWNLQYLIDKALIDPPHVLTLFFGWPGGTWSPPTIESYLYRIKYMPENCLHTISVMGEQQIKIAAAAITHGGNVRVGTEDYPFIKKDIPAKNNAEIVSNMVKLCKQLGREVADPTEARKIIGI